MNDEDTRTSGLPDHAELAVGWVLHALDADQEAEFLAHLELEGCAECTATIADTADTLEVLARSVPQEEPPADLRYRLMAAAEAERPAPDAATGDVPFTGARASRDVPMAPQRENGTAPSRAGSSSDGDSATVLPMRPRRRSRLLVAAAAAVAVIVIGGLAVANQSLRAERDQQASAVQQYDRVVDVMRDAGAPGAVSAPLTDPRGALVGLVVDQGAGPEVLTTSLGANASDQTYVLWALAGPGPAPTALGIFDVPGGGASVRSVPSSPPVGPVAGYAVSLEPGRAAPAAPTLIVARGQVGR